MRKQSATAKSWRARRGFGWELTQDIVAQRSTAEQQEQPKKLGRCVRELGRACHAANIHSAGLTHVHGPASHSQGLFRTGRKLPLLQQAEPGRGKGIAQTGHSNVQPTRVVSRVRPAGRRGWLAANMASIFSWAPRTTRSRTTRSR